MDAFKTPQKGAREETCEIHSLSTAVAAMSFEVCSVCLSPCAYQSQLLSPSSSCVKKTVIETKCKHHFHERCLNEAKSMKPECPMCRCPLTPLADHQSTEFPNLMRQAVISAAARGRNAVRERMLRAERERAAMAMNISAAVQ